MQVVSAFDTNTNTTTTTPVLDPLQFPSLTPGGDDEAPVGKWDDEMEALDAKRGI